MSSLRIRYREEGDRPGGASLSPVRLLPRFGPHQRAVWMVAAAGVPGLTADPGASRAAIDVFASEVLSRLLEGGSVDLAATVSEALAEGVASARRQTRGRVAMPPALAGALLHDGMAYAGRVGAAEVHLVRASEGTPEAAVELVHLTPEVSPGPRGAEPEVYAVPLRPGDALVLAAGGTGRLRGEHVAAAAQEGHTPAEVAPRLVELARAHGATTATAVPGPSAIRAGRRRLRVRRVVALLTALLVVAGAVVAGVLLSRPPGQVRPARPAPVTPSPPSRPAPAPRPAGPRAAATPAPARTHWFSVQLEATPQGLRGRWDPPASGARLSAEGASVTRPGAFLIPWRGPAPPPQQVTLTLDRRPDGRLDWVLTRSRALVPRLKTFTVDGIAPPPNRASPLLKTPDVARAAFAAAGTMRPPQKRISLWLAGAQEVIVTVHLRG